MGAYKILQKRLEEFGPQRMSLPQPAHAWHCKVECRHSSTLPAVLQARSSW